MTFAAALPVLLAFSPVVADKASRSVTFTALATDAGKGTTVEFAFVGPKSDRAYEAMFMTDADIAEIAKAFDEAGIPRGAAISSSACRFWPAGKSIAIEPPIWDFIDDSKDEKPNALCYTGGLRDGRDYPIADTNMPAAVFSLYSLDQSLILLDNTVDQSAVYGRFVSNGAAEKGKRYTFKVSWDGKTGTRHRELTICPGKLKDAIETLKNEKGPLDVLPVFSPLLTVAEAKAAAAALSVVDSQTVRINGFKEGQFYYRGFLPDENWRDRKKRLVQPLEVRITGATNAVCTVIDEDWSVEGMDPKLTPHEEPMEKLSDQFKGDTCLFFAKADLQISQIHSLMKQLPKTIRNWYVFVD